MAYIYYEDMVRKDIRQVKYQLFIYKFVFNFRRI
jgi:hypothetical protein